MAFTTEEKIKCAVIFEQTKSAVTVRRTFKKMFKKEAPPASTIRSWHKKLMTTGSLITPNKGNQARTSRNEENFKKVEDHFKENPHSSTRRASLILDVSQSSVVRILKNIKWHPYKVQVIQKLSAEDLAKRSQFAHEELARIENNSMHLANLMFSDGAHFHLDGAVNRHNHRYWAPKNPHWTLEKGLHSPRTTVWAAIWQGGVCGPFFFDECINSERYLALLQNVFWPKILENKMENSIIFMQDGAPPHWGLQVREWLNETLPLRWMGRGSPNMPWPPRSPDLTPCDYFMWGFLKSKVYKSKPTTIQDLKSRIQEAFQEITLEMCRKVIENYQHRLTALTQNGGCHVEVHK